MAINSFHSSGSDHAVSRTLIIVTGLLAIVSGLVASLGVPLLALFLAAPVIAVLLATRPILLLWLVLVGGLVVAGVTTLYVPMLRQARWGVALAAMLLGAIAIIAHFVRNPPRSPLPHGLQERRGTLMVWAFAFFSLTLFSGLLNDGATLDTMIGLKNYFQVWGILLAFALLPMSAGSADRMMAFLVWLGVLQLPFALHETFFLVPQRMSALDAGRNIVAQDIVVGTFSGSMSGGGAGASMTVLLGIALTVLLARWRSGRLGIAALVVSCLACLAPIALGEHKLGMVFVVLIPLIVYGDQLVRNPVRTVAFGAISLAVAVLLFIAFTMLPRTGGSRNLTVDEYLQQAVDYNVGDKGYGSLYLNRKTVYAFWWQAHQSPGRIVNALIGYGPGATNESRTGFRERSYASTQYPLYGIGLTGLSGLLWEVGVLGTAAALGFLVSAFLIARRLALKAGRVSARWAYLKGAEAGVLMVTLSLLHSGNFLFEIGLQTLLVLLVGYLWHFKSRPVDGESAARVQF